ncbi:hypothetical protein N0V93_001023 [Gnomoniopsis smithogilvyi]|uniref:Cytochrome P450 n=1 Tax=Gnomoniopsis smithogilvyi TaxID=1191159 RepID=A0A9W9D2C2_9PEZI|nr:hypothetical protein N0V93_001023 [Gnomoniopsis smithogilvyi]
MASTLAILGSFLIIYCISLLYRISRNLVNARRSGLPYIIIPWDQNSFLWMVVSVPLRPWLATHMPKWINDRLSLTIWGFEFHEKLRAFHQYAAPQGNDRSYAIVTPGKLEIHTRDTEIVHDVLRRPNDFFPMTETELFMNRFGSNVLTSSGDSWARQRKLVASVINERISKTVFHESIQQTKGLIDEVLAGKEVGESTRVFDMLKKITINVLSGAGMGASVDWDDDKGEKPNGPYRQTYMEAVKHVINGVAGPIILPEWVLSNYPSFLPGYKTLKPLGYAVQEFPIHTRRKLEEERQRTIAAHGETRSNIMAQLLQASDQGGDPTTTKSRQALSEEEMLGNLFIFTAAGFDTTANTLAYALALLCRYPSWQNWLFEEIDAVMPSGDDPSKPLDYAAIYPTAIRIQACMLEVLRLFPPAVHMAKMTRTPQKIPTSRGIVQLPAGATVYSHNVGLHIDPEVWRNLNLHPGEEASDVDELVFRPTRWLTNAASMSHEDGTAPPLPQQQQLFKPPKGSYVPWSSGPRVCPGQKMAQVEFTAIFLRLFQAHRVEAVPLVKENGAVETIEEVEKRLEGRLKNSISILTLQMNDVYDVAEGDERGLKLRLVQRR